MTRDLPIIESVTTDEQPAPRSLRALAAATPKADKVNLFDLDRSGIEALFEQIGEKRFRAHQVMKWIYHRHVTDFAEMTDLGKTLRSKIEAVAEVRPPNIVFEKDASDGVHKWLLGMDGGNAIETVFIPDKGRGTLCVSSQVGCGLNCQFCSTATLGNVPHRQRKLTNVVMMGMGEPLLNFDNVVKAMSLMRDDLGLGLANKRVTLSTSGLVPMIDRLSAESDVSLAVSLHAPTDELRTELVPLNKKYPIAELMAACQRYISRRPRTSVTFEYTLMKGVNDQPEHARGLIKLLRRLPSKLNLIPFNPFPGTRFERSDETTIRAYQKIVLDGGVLTTVRRTRGDDIDAACGQLKGQVMDRTRRQQAFRDKLQQGVERVA